MKKIFIGLLIVCMLFSAVGCSFFKTREKVFSIDNYDLQITADATFYDSTVGEFDLQITNNKSYISIMAYKYIDLSSALTPRLVYKMQNDDLFSKRNEVSVVEAEKTSVLSDRTVTYALYSAEKEGIKNYYSTYLIDIPEKEVFAWVLVSSTPSYLLENRAYLDGIVFSLSSID